MKSQDSKIPPRIGGDASPRAGTGLASGRGAAQESPEASPRSKDAVSDSGKTPFIERTPVSGFFTMTVFANVSYIGLDVHLRATDSSAGQALEMPIEATFGLIFTVELVLRIFTDRCPRFLYNKWNILDTFLVVAGVMDITFSFALQSGDSSNNAAEDVGKIRVIRLLKFMRFIRVLRVMRVFRYKRIMKAMRGFLVLATAIYGALKALGWVALMILMATYMCSIITTEFIGIENKMTSSDELINEWFGDIGKSMFTLFQLSTLQEWATISRYVSKESGGIWTIFFILYIAVTHFVLMNVVLGTLIENIAEISADVKDVHAGLKDDAASWMKTPESLVSEDSEEDEDKKAAAAGTAPHAAAHGHGGLPHPGAGAIGMPSVADKMAMQSLSELFDLTATYVGVEGVNQRKLATQASLTTALARQEVQDKLCQACPAMSGHDPESMATQIWGACPKKFDAAGLNRQELAEASMALSGALSMNHFVVISQALQALERRVEHELVHLNKHQRKMNRRFLKLRHRLRKVYHFDGAPRNMVKMVNDMKKKNLMQAVHNNNKGSGDASPTSGAEQTTKAEEADDGSSIALSQHSSDSQEANW